LTYLETMQKNSAVRILLVDDDSVDPRAFPGWTEAKPALRLPSQKPLMGRMR